MVEGDHDGPAHTRRAGEQRPRHQRCGAGGRWVPHRQRQQQPPFPVAKWRDAKTGDIRRDYGQRCDRDQRLRPGGGVFFNGIGHRSGTAAAALANEQFRYGVDYLGFYLRRAAEAYRTGNGTELDKVNIIAPSTRGLMLNNRQPFFLLAREAGRIINQTGRHGYRCEPARGFDHCVYKPATNPIQGANLDSPSRGP